MTPVLEVILPRQANNDYRGGTVALVGFCLLIAQKVFSSTVHLLKHDSGKNSIGGMIRFEGIPDPNEALYAVGAIGGSHEMLLVLLCALVLWRYRNLVPLMFCFTIVEMSLRSLVSMMHPLGAEYFEHTPPARLAMLPLLLFASLMLFLAVRKSRRS